jgi:hypothetical protein
MIQPRISKRVNTRCKTLHVRTGLSASGPTFTIVLQHAHKYIFGGIYSAQHVRQYKNGHEAWGSTIQFFGFYCKPNLPGSLAYSRLRVVYAKLSKFLKQIRTNVNVLNRLLLYSQVSDRLNASAFIVLSCSSFGASCSRCLKYIYLRSFSVM